MQISWCVVAYYRRKAAESTTQTSEYDSALTRRFVRALQCPLDIATSDIAAALPIATSNPVTDLHQSINYNLVYNDR